MAASDSRVDRSKSVSSMRSTNVPPVRRASSQLKSAVRALPTCSCPVGLGANRTRTGGDGGVVIAESAPPRARRSPGRRRSRPRPRWSCPSRSPARPPHCSAAARFSRICVARTAAASAAPRSPRRRRWRRSSPPPATSDAACASSFTLSAPFHCGSVSGKCRPMSPSAAAPSTASVTAWHTTSASECPGKTAARTGSVTPPSTSGRPATSRCRS